MNHALYAMSVFTEMFTMRRNFEKPVTMAVSENKFVTYHIPGLTFKEGIRKAAELHLE